MSVRFLSILFALLLAACGGETLVAEKEAEQGTVATGGANDGGASEAPVPVMGPERHILAFGNSLFAGYNVAAENAYPAKLETALRARGVNARVTNAGVSGDTTAAGLQRLPFTLDSQRETPDLVILELGGNDLLRGLSPEQTRANLDQMLRELQRREIPVILFGMRAPPNLGSAYVRAYDNMYPDLAERYGAELVPFFLEPIYDRPELIQQDRIHPTAQGIEALVGYTADDVAEALPAPAEPG